jgi:hypothetical protein
LKIKIKPIKIRTVNTDDRTVYISEDQRLYESLSKKEKSQIFDIQQRLFDSGFGKDKNLVQKECWNEAMKQFVQLER